MTEYLIALIEGVTPAADEQARLMDARAAWTAQLEKEGALRDTERLRDSHEGRRVHRVGNTVHVEQGPFTEPLASYWAVSAEDLEAAVALAKRLPVLPGDTVEVRPIMKGSHDPKKTDKTGKVFAFEVLGNAPNEEAWIRLMNRIDAETDNHATRDFISGLRLEAPRTGRRLVTQQGRTVVLDGPFPESKEVIGGLFFMRLPSLEDAVAWVSTLAYVGIGATEIREVWRS